LFRSEIVLAAHATAETKDLARHRLRIDLDEVARSVPQVAGSTDELMRLIGPVNLDPELLERKVDHPALHVVGVHVDDGQDHIRIVGRALRVGQELLVLGEVKSQAAVALERRMLAPGVVDDPNELTFAWVVLPLLYV